MDSKYLEGGLADHWAPRWLSSESALIWAISANTANEALKRQNFNNPIYPNYVKCEFINDKICRFPGYLAHDYTTYLCQIVATSVKICSRGGDDGARHDGSSMIVRRWDHKTLNLCYNFSPRYLRGPQEIKKCLESSCSNQKALICTSNMKQRSRIKD